MKRILRSADEGGGVLFIVCAHEMLCCAHGLEFIGVEKLSIPASRNEGNLSDQQMHADSMGAEVLMAPLTNVAALSI